MANPKVGASPRLDALFDTSASDKGALTGDRHRYGSLYEVLLAPRKARKTRLLELGVGKGASIHAWLRYFDDVEIHGIDRELSLCELPEEIRARASLYEGDVRDAALVSHVGGFDIVIDDADHAQQAQNDCLVAYWPKLEPGGLYVIEDLFVGRLPWGVQASPSPRGLSRRRYDGFSAAPERDYLPERPQDLTFLNRDGLPEKIVAILDGNNYFFAITNVSRGGGLHMALVIQKAVGPS